MCSFLHHPATSIIIIILMALALGSTLGVPCVPGLILLLCVRSSHQPHEVVLVTCDVLHRKLKHTEANWLAHDPTASKWQRRRFCCSVISDSCDPMDCTPPGPSVHGILQARVQEWVAMPSSRGSSWPRDWTQVSCIAGRFFTNWATREAPRIILEWIAMPSSRGSSQPRDWTHVSHVEGGFFTSWAKDP